MLDPYPTTNNNFYTVVDGILSSSTAIVTLVTAQRPGLRLVAALLHHLLPDPFSCCFAHSLEEYIEKAMAIAHNRDGAREKFLHQLEGARQRYHDAGKIHTEEWSTALMKFAKRG